MISRTDHTGSKYMPHSLMNHTRDAGILPTGDGFIKREMVLDGTVRTYVGGV